MSVVMLVLLGCASKPIEVTAIRVSPVSLSLEVTKVENDKVPQRKVVTARVLEKETDWPDTVHLVVDDAPDEQLFSVGRRVRVKFDTSDFDKEKRIGFSFWRYSDLAPTALEQRPNQSGTANAGICHAAPE